MVKLKRGQRLPQVLLWIFATFRLRVAGLFTVVFSRTLDVTYTSRPIRGELDFDLHTKGAVGDYIRTHGHSLKLMKQKLMGLLLVYCLLRSTTETWKGLLIELVDEINKRKLEDYLEMKSPL